MTWPTSDELVKGWSCDHPKVMLAFSRGKDALAAWLHMRPHFEQIVPIHYYLVPGLEFVERSIRYYEEWFETKIIQLPHPSLHRMLSNYVFQPPQQSRLEVLSAAGLPDIDYNDLRAAVASMNLVWPVDDAWIAVGTRACDSPQRRMAFNKWGPTNHKDRTFMPVWDWNKARVVETIKSAGVKLPAEYRVFGRSFDGIDFRFLCGVRQHWPDDYQRILNWFPLAQLELERYEFKLKRGEIRG